MAVISHPHLNLRACFTARTKRGKVCLLDVDLSEHMWEAIRKQFSHLAGKKAIGGGFLLFVHLFCAFFFLLFRFVLSNLCGSEQRALISIVTKVCVLWDPIRSFHCLAQRGSSFPLQSWLGQIHCAMYSSSSTGHVLHATAPSILIC